MIHFSEQVGFWSKFVFWFALVNTVATLAFTIVVIIGGFYDLRYLFHALRSPDEESQDE
jgi:hypothetical protein